MRKFRGQLFRIIGARTLDFTCMCLRLADNFLYLLDSTSFFVELSTARKTASCRSTVVHVLSLKHDVQFPATVY